MENALGNASQRNILEVPSTLLCFSHLRWNFVFQRPQHILTLASKTENVIYFEEPVFEETSHPGMRTTDISPSIKVITPVLPSEPTPRKRRSRSDNSSTFWLPRYPRSGSQPGTTRRWRC